MVRKISDLKNEGMGKLNKLLKDEVKKADEKAILEIKRSMIKEIKERLPIEAEWASGDSFVSYAIDADGNITAAGYAGEVDSLEDLTIVGLANILMRGESEV